MVSIPEQVHSWLDGQEFAVLATVMPNGQPHQSVVWVAREGDDVLVSTVKGRRKHQNLVNDPRCSLLVYPRDNPYSYVEIRGRADVTEVGGRELIDRLCQHYTGQSRYTADDGTDNIRVVVRISVDKVVTLIR